MITVEYVLEDLPDGEALDIEEDRGRIVLKIGRHLTPEQIVSALNEGSKQILAGGHWFQEWKGDIVSFEPGADENPSTTGRRLPVQRHLRDVSRPDSAAS